MGILRKYANIVSKIAAVGAAILLTFIGLLHVIWAFGIYWPAQDYQEFLNMFWGETSPMPPLWTGIILAVVFFIGSYGYVNMAWGRSPFLPKWLWTSGLTALFIIIGLRGVLAPLEMFRGELEPYKTLNLSVYSPLCIFIAHLGGFALFLRPEKNDWFKTFIRRLFKK